MSQQDQADALLEIVALAHDIECELRPCADGGWEIVDCSGSWEPRLFPVEPEQLATSLDPMAAVIELQRDLEAA